MSCDDLNLVTVKLTSTPAEIPAASNLSFYSGVMNEATADATNFWASIRELRSLMRGSTYLEGPAIPIIGVGASNLFLAQ